MQFTHSSSGGHGLTIFRGEEDSEETGWVETEKK